MSMLNNASIRTKSLIATTIGVLVLIGMAALSIMSIVEIGRASVVRNEASDLTGEARDAWIDLSRGQAALYRAINLKAQNVEAGLVRAAKTEFTEASERAKRRITTLKVNG